MPALQREWLRRGAAAWALWPVSLLFGALAALRRGAYRAGLIKSERLPVPVIVVGNVIAGGSGKTPLVMALVAHLRSRGIAPGVVSRGYGRAGGHCLEVKPDSDARDTGDEPLLIARSCDVPVFVCADRVQAARALLEAYPATQVILCDDGLQHYRLRRDLEICVFDERGVGNGWLLPAGPLRESWPREVDLIVRTRETPGIGGFVIERQLARHALRADGTSMPLQQLKGRRLKALAAIAKPQVFFAMLREEGLALEETIALPDHAVFTHAACAKEDSRELLCTEKDAVKLWRLCPKAWAVPLLLTVDPAFWRRFDSLLDAKLSSAHGSQTS
ncbi:MAG TPA: tetraacyldisaccharide 4'-kinase [Ramlibacter sp.]|nr:tetraacyldisaccharide 4'-kinase [Ramlibacter sp.]